MENKVVGVQWLGPVDCLPHGFLCWEFSQSSPFLESAGAIAKKPTPTDSHGHWMGISSIKHCLLGSKEWRMKW
jgi:hypothetical protein